MTERASGEVEAIRVRLNDLRLYVQSRISGSHGFAFFSRVGVLIPIFYNFIASYEEKLLEDRFPEEYRNYQKDRELAAVIG